MTDVVSQWAKTTRPTGQPSPYVSSALATGRGSQAELRVTLPITPENLNQDDDWYFLRLPADAIVQAVILTTDELDSGTAMTLQIRANTSNLLSAASNIGRTGGTAFGNANLPFVGNGTDPVALYARVTAAPAQAGDRLPGNATLVVHFTRP